MKHNERHPDRNSEIRRRYSAGESAGDIGLSMKISRNVVAGVVDRAGIKTGGPRPHQRAKIADMHSRRMNALVAGNSRKFQQQMTKARASLRQLWRDTEYRERRIASQRALASSPEQKAKMLEGQRRWREAQREARA